MTDHTFRRCPCGARVMAHGPHELCARCRGARVSRTRKPKTKEQMRAAAAKEKRKRLLAGLAWEGV